MGQERLLEFRRLVDQRQARGGPHHLPLVDGQHRQAAPGAGVGGQVVGLVLRRTVVKVGKLAKHRKAQASEVIDVRRNRSAVQQADFHA